MSDKRPTTRKDLMKPAQLLTLALIGALFAGIVTLVSMGFFQRTFPGEGLHALSVAAIVAGVTFIVTAVVIALLLLAVQPGEITHRVDGPVLIGRDQRYALEMAAKDAAAKAGAAGAGAAGAATGAAAARAAGADGAAGVGAASTDPGAGAAEAPATGETAPGAVTAPGAADSASGAATDGTAPDKA
ncbi:hypothetical protein GCM10022240_03340 [Microbacterium kribbense]|uniref:Amino acid transporter n=1 Tax=Microbacterium kribbense TaxID=433645 RepID=A0ABP7G320_9MICO